MYTFTYILCVYTILFRFEISLERAAIQTAAPGDSSAGYATADMSS